jgi:hypothetical protein
MKNFKVLLEKLDVLETWDKYEFGFYLTEGVGTVDKNLSPNIGNANEKFSQFSN